MKGTVIILQREAFSSADSTSSTSAKSRSVRRYGTARHIAVIFAAFIISMSTVFGKPSPFSASFTAALSGLDCISSFLGSVMGYILTGNYADCVTVTSALLSVMAVRLIVSRAGKKDGRAADIISAVTAAGSVFTASFITSRSVSDMLACCVLGLMAGGGALVIQNIKRLFKQRELAALNIKSNPAGFLSVLIGCIIAASIAAHYTFNIFNFGIILSALMSCFAAMKYGSGAGAVCGAATALGVSLGTGEYFYLAAILATAAAVAGIFAGEKKLSCAGAFVLAATLVTALFKMDNNNLALTADVFLGGAVFMLLPAAWSDRERNMREKSAADNSIRELFSRRLKFAEGAIDEVRRTIDLTASKLDPKPERDLSRVYNTACDKICRRCRYNMQCWGKEYGDSIKQFSRLTNVMKSGGEPTPDMFSAPLSDRCPKKDELCQKLSELYRSYAAAESEKRRIARMRGVLTVQLSATEKLLSQLSEEIAVGGEIHSEYNETARRVLFSLSCEDVTAVNLSVGEQGRISLEAYSDKGFFCTKQELCDAMSLAFGRQFDLPVISRVGDSYKLSMFSKTTYYLDVEICQISKNDGAACGDYYESFIDSRGIAYVVLSDGMGSGSRARVDSSFACGMLIRLLQAGVGIEAALNIINTSLMVKSSDESFATLEICKIDLYSGFVELYKAGSANTYIKCGSKNSRLGCKGLPIGVRETPVYEKQTFTIGSRDMIVITSDGAELNEKWLFREMDKPDLELKEFTRLVADTAKFYSGDGKSDDISVIAMRLYR